MSSFRFTPREAQAAGHDVGQILKDWQAHLLAERDAARDNPAQFEARTERLSLAIKQAVTASGWAWEVLGGLPEGLPSFTVRATSIEAARNKMHVRELIEQRLRRELAKELQRVGLYHRDLEGRRAAVQASLDAQVWVADASLVTT